MYFFENADLNTLKFNGEFYIRNGINWPLAQNGFLNVFAQSDKFVYQRYKAAFNGKTYERLLTNGVWGAWVQIVHVVTNWLSTGVSNVFYKTDGTTVHLRGFVRATANNQVIVLGTVPRTLLPQQLMFTIPIWSLNGADNKHLQIDVDGTIKILHVDNNQEFHFNVSWGT